MAELAFQQIDADLQAALRRIQGLEQRAAAGTHAHRSLGIET